ncbi:hypothetical protein KPL71_011812 [Citrus sinensis]|uniref:Uncharacterized protein n=1 Tax=Citrus sinensis TaxID=2711 RepID=A0ACB8L683_CITSI|nr:hypothetical protein KPL71_011812 [Citrus sinensis]
MGHRIERVRYKLSTSSGDKSPGNGGLRGRIHRARSGFRPAGYCYNRRRRSGLAGVSGWILWGTGFGAEIVLEGPEREEIFYAIRLEFMATNNQAKYEALIAELELAKAVKADKVKIRTDSQLVANHVSERFQPRDGKMKQYLKKVKLMIRKFESVEARIFLADDALGCTGENHELHELPEFYKFLYPAIREAHYYGLAMAICSMRNRSDWTVAEGTGGSNACNSSNRLFHEVGRGRSPHRITEKKTTDFIWRNPICRYGIPYALITDNGRQFDNHNFRDFCQNLGIELKFCSPTHPQTTHKTVTGETPFALAFGHEAVVPMEIGTTTHRIDHFDEHENNDQMCLNLDLLTKKREQASKRSATYQQRVARYYNQKVRVRQFKVGDSSKRNETLLLQTDLSKANMVIPKSIQWKDIHLPDEWILEGAAPPAIPKQLEPNTELQNVTQYSDGKVKLSFRRSTSHRFSDKESSSSIPSLERKFTKVPSVINLPYQSQPRFSTSDIPSSSIRSVDYATSVPHPIYTSSQHVQKQEEKEPSPPTSPTIIESDHPPLRSITIDHGEPPTEIKASPYKIPRPNDSDANLSSIIQQNNFCNTNLNTIGKQLARIENQFQKSTISVSPIPMSIPSKSDSDKKLKEPIFKPFQVSKTSQKLVQESKSDFAKAIREQLDRIEAASSSSSKLQIAPDTPQSSKIGVLDLDDQSSIASSDLEAFKEEPSTPKANKIHWELALPTVKTPPDLAIDNRPSALNQSRYNASSVYEWNIDGMSEYNILGLLQQMTMAANAYKTQAGTSDRAISEILIAGFTGQLKGWWDHLLTNQQQFDILNSVQKDENGASILDEFNNPIQDAVATLILTISLHFIGDPSHLRDKNAELLHNLRCRKLSEFQSYKTSFLTRLFLRDDANHITWKEKFLAGLPTLLGEKVRNSIKALYDNRIPYDELTYGELVSFVNKEGLKICQDLKLQKRLKWELKKSKQELGGFCKQFNYDPFKTSKDCNGECSTKPRKKHYKSKHFRKPFRDFRKLPYKKPSKPYKKHSFSKKKDFKVKPNTPFNFKEATCFKCGMKGHTAKFCRMNKRLQELDLNEDILSKIAPLLVESSDSESSMTGDSDPYQVDELFDSDDSASSSSESESDSFLKKINVLTKDQETFLELVKHISDPNLQKEYLDKLLKTLDFNKAETSRVPIVKKNSYDLTQILDKKKTKKMIPNIQDLQKEIKEIKSEIRDLKEKQKSDSDIIQLLLQRQLQDNSDNESSPDIDGDDIKGENIESVPKDFLFVLKQITTRKYLIKVTLIFSDDFAMDAIALFDTGADLNCIREDIVPKRFHEKTKERLSAANNSKLNVSSKKTTFSRSAL